MGGAEYAFANFTHCIIGGYNIQTGEHLYFCSGTNPGVKTGDTLNVKVSDVVSMLGSYIISYEIVK